MISQRINRPLLANTMLQMLDQVYFSSKQIMHDSDSFIFKCYVYLEPAPCDEFLELFDAETISEMQKNINRMLTASKHLLNYNKQDIIWFQKALSRIKNARGAFKN